jgi:hypothetical protein
LDHRRRSRGFLRGFAFVGVAHGLEAIVSTQNAHRGQCRLAQSVGIALAFRRHSLQKSGLIQYSRRKIKIIDRKVLLECACECYSDIRERIDKSFPLARQ